MSEQVSESKERKINRVMYIILFGGFFGCWLCIAAIYVLSRLGFHDVNAVAILTFVGCFVLGGFLGELIGRYRNYKR
ncbi:MAG: hypothetical protein ACQCN3_12775 [Candidatus Bathyarchaeia archaeon]|jgi:uncharacterized membrane protein YdcZ (DUF606 family)